MARTKNPILRFAGGSPDGARSIRQTFSMPGADALFSVPTVAAADVDLDLAYAAINAWASTRAALSQADANELSDLTAALAAAAEHLTDPRPAARDRASISALLP